MDQVHLKFVLNALNDETNLAQSLPSLIPSVLSLSHAGNDDASLAKLHTRISTLLQSKSVGVRWSGICLAKAVLERQNGKWESLMSHGSTWMKLLLKVLERETSEPVIERATSTVCTIIQMTEGKPSLTRELTTPSLPTFFTHVFTILGKPSTSDNLTKAMLYRIQQSLITHPTTFRPFAGKLQALVSRNINGSCTDAQLIELSARCFVSLHLCAPKNTAADQWTTGFLAVIGECHATLSYIFQTVVEEKATLPIPGGLDMLLFSSDYSSQVPLAVRRLHCLVQTVIAFLNLPTKDVVKIPVGQLVMLMQRMLEVTPKSGIKASTPQTSQVALLSVLPQLHSISFGLLHTSIEVLGKNMQQHIHLLQELLLVHCSSTDRFCRVSALEALAASLRLFSFVGSDKQSFGSMVRHCVTTLEQVVPSISNLSTSTNNGQGHGQKKRKHGGVNDGSDQISNQAAFHQYPSADLVESVVNVLGICLQHTFGVLTKGTRQTSDSAVLRLLQANAGTLASSTIIQLLSLLKSSLTAPDASVSAAAMLSATINTVSTFCRHRDPAIRAAAVRIRDDLEVFVHPRFPAIRGRVHQILEDEDHSESDAKSEMSTQEMAILQDDDNDEIKGKDAELEKEVKVSAESPSHHAAFPVPTSYPATQTQVPVLSPIEPDQKKPKLDETISRESVLDETMNTESVLDGDEEIPEICMDSDTDVE